MITSQNIGKLLENIKNSKKTESLFFQITKSVIKKTTKNKSYNFSLIKNNIETDFKLSLLYKSILDILIPIIREKKKLTIAQLGQSIDGRIALNNGNSHYINHKKGIHYLHCLRSISDAIIVGSNTIKKDNPQLTTRKIKGSNPRRIIIDGRLSLTNKYKIFNDGYENIIFTKSKKNKILNNSTIIRLDKNDFTKKIIYQINKLGYKYVLIEGGSKTISEFINNKYIDLLQFIIAPIVIGSGINSLNLKEIKSLNKALRPKFSYNILEKELVVNLFLNR